MDKKPQEENEQPHPELPNDLQEIAKAERKELGHPLNVMGEIYNEYSPEEGGDLSEGIAQMEAEAEAKNQQKS